ncbi:MAG: transcription antitermination factor NusB [Rhodospirillales bacterium]
MALKTGIAKRLTAPGLSARAVALELLSQVLDGGIPLDEAWANHPGIGGLSEPDRAFARHLAATTLRRLGQIDALIDACLNKPLAKRAQDVRYVLRIGIAQLLFLETPAHAAVDIAVKLTDVYGFQAQKGFVNAVLRRLANEGPAMIAGQDVARLNTPDWLWQSWCAAYGEETARGIATAHLGEPPLDITVKTDSLSSPESWAKKLDGVLLPNGSVRRTKGGKVDGLPGFKEGAWWVQDAAAALPAVLFGDVKGKRVIDLCAAPGGKTAQLIDRGAAVAAVDRSEGRLKVLRNNLARLGFKAETVAADAIDWRPDHPADAVLLDAPCSATGTLRRHPDIARLKSAADVASLAARQRELLQAAAEMVRPGGLLVFCTCSLQPEEGPGQIEAFLKEHADFERQRLAGDDVCRIDAWLTAEGELRTLPCHLAEQGGMDGFFAARLRRIR